MVSTSLVSTSPIYTNNNKFKNSPESSPSATIKGNSSEQLSPPIAASPITSAVIPLVDPTTLQKLPNKSFLGLENMNKQLIKENVDKKMPNYFVFSDLALWATAGTVAAYVCADGLKDGVTAKGNISPACGMDKLEHFGGSYALYNAFYLLLNNSDQAALAAGIIGLGKEISDQISPTGSGFDSKDLMADFLGIAAAVALDKIKLRVELEKYTTMELGLSYNQDSLQGRVKIGF